MGKFFQADWSYEVWAQALRYFAPGVALAIAFVFCRAMGVGVARNKGHWSGPIMATVLLCWLAGYILTNDAMSADRYVATWSLMFAAGIYGAVDGIKRTRHRMHLEELDRKKAQEKRELNDFVDALHAHGYPVDLGSGAKE